MRTSWLLKEAPEGPDEEEEEPPGAPLVPMEVFGFWLREMEFWMLVMDCCSFFC